VPTTPFDHTVCSAYELQEPSSEIFSPESVSRLKARLNELSSSVVSSLRDQGFSDGRIKCERLLNMRFDGTDTALMVLEEEGNEYAYEETFKKQYKAEFGFLLEEKNIIVDDIKVWRIYSP
jgi:5-oxoprolinase (ATP-hydrolysing)